jgi:hypothetical protein
MNEYKELLNQLNTILIRIGEYENQIKDLQSFMEQKSNQNNDLIDKQISKVDELKLKINSYIDNYNLVFKNAAQSLTEKLDNAAQMNIEKVKSELTKEVSQVLVAITSSFKEVYGNLNENRKELLYQLQATVEINKKEEISISQLNQQMMKQNEYLRTINNESKSYIDQYFNEIRSLKEELDLMKENFELKYVFNRKRILITSIASLSLITMIIITFICAAFMFAYYSRLIFFPNRSNTLLYGILLSVLGIGLLCLLIVILVKPPTFLRIKKNIKIKGVHHVKTN